MAGITQEEFVQAVLTVHTYIHTHVDYILTKTKVSYMELLYISFIHTQSVCLSVCLYVQSKLPAQIGTTGSIYRELLFCNLSLHMYNIVWAMLTVWDNWLAGKYMEGCGGDVSNL